MNRFKKTRRDVDEAEAIGCFLLVVWGISALLTLGFVGVIVWAVIKLVQHFTS